MPKHWILVQNVWSVGGANDSNVPNITADWEADSDNTWTVPFGAAIGRIFKIGEQHVNLKGGVY